MSDYESLMGEVVEEPRRGAEEVDGATINFLDDDSVEVDFDDDDTGPDPDINVFASDGFAANLALRLTKQQRDQLASDLLEMVEADIDSRKEHDALLEDALELLGLRDLPDDRAPFAGASQINNPVLGEAVIDFQARAMDELFPASGPVKGTVIGKKTEERLQKADRVEHYMNYQLIEKDEGYYDDTDQMVLKMPIYGTMFRRGYQDVITGEPRLRSVPSSRCHVPYDAKSIYDTPRLTYEYSMHQNDLRRAMANGAFVEVPLTDVTPEPSGDVREEDVSDKRTESRADGDNVYTLMEMYVDHELPAGIDEYQVARKYALPYIITFCKELGTVLAVRRNWKKSDEQCMRRNWITVYRYLPGLGFYGWGLLHVIGAAAKASSGALRALLDAAAGSNLPGGFVSKEGANLKDGDLEFEPGVFKKVHLSADELEKAFKHLPVKEPSPALFNLYQEITNFVRSFANKTEQMVGEASNNGPVGTTLALIEQTMKVFSGIHKRMHAAQRREFKILHTLNGELLTEQSYDYDVEGESRFVLKDDFDSDVDVVPVSDPNIYSNTQRITQAQIVLEAVTKDPTGSFDEDSVYEAYMRFFRAIRIPEPEKILPDKRVKRTDPVAENMLIQTGKPVRAFPEQDHAAHIAVHQHFMQLMESSGQPEVMERLAPVMQAHIAEHIALKYQNDMHAMLEQVTGEGLPTFDLQSRERPEIPPQLDAQIARQVAELAPQLMPPPPPPQQGPTPEQIEAENQAARENEEFERSQERKDAETAAEIERKDKKAAADIERDRIKAEAKNKGESANKLMQLFDRVRGRGRG